MRRVRKVLVALFVVVLGAAVIVMTLVGVDQPWAQWLTGVTYSQYWGPVLGALLAAWGVWTGIRPSPQVKAIAKLGDRADAHAGASASRDAAMSDRLDEALEILRKAAPGAGFDATTEQGLKATLANLFSAQEGAKKRASEKLLIGDRDGALSELKQFAARENEAVANAAETQKEIGALAFLDRTSDAIAAYERAAQLAPDDPYARNQLGHLYRRVGRLADAESAYRHILDTAGKNDEGWQAAVLGNLGLVAETRSDLGAAEDYLKRALAIDEKLGNLQGQAAGLGNLGLVARARGDLDAAEDSFRRALAIDEKLGNVGGQANHLSNLGNVARRRGKLDLAEDNLKRALTMNEQLGRTEGQIGALDNLGLVALQRGDLDAAETCHKRSLTMSEGFGNLEDQAVSLGNLGIVALVRGDLDGAEGYNQRALAINEKLGRLEGIAITLGNLGTLAEKRGDLKSTQDYWLKAIALHRRIGAPHMVEKLSRWLREKGVDPDAASPEAP